MLKKSLLIFFIYLMTTIIFADKGILNETYTLTRKDWLKTRISNYLSGFQRFDYALLIVEPQIRISVYISNDTERKDAENILKRWENQIKMIKNEYEWAKHLKVITETYFENSSSTKR